MKYWNERLSEHEEFSIAEIGYIDESDIKFTKVIIDGFNIFAKSKHSTNKKFKKLFRRKGSKVLPYFKIITVNDITHEAIGVCRISLYNAKYLSGYGENMVLNKDQIDKLINIFNEDSYIIHDDKRCKKVKKWEYMIYMFNKEFKMNGIKYHIPNNLKMPDYMKLMEVIDNE